MAVIINASTSTGLVQSADTSGQINIQSNGTTVLGVTSTGTSVTGTQSVSGNLSFNSGYGSSAVAYGCRAWVNFDGTTNTGGFCTIRGSGNVTSITDHGTGDFTANLTNALPDVNYCVHFSLGALDSNFWGPIPYIYSQATTSCRVRSVFSSGTFNDPGTCNIAIFR